MDFTYIVIDDEPRVVKANVLLLAEIKRLTFKGSFTSHYPAFEFFGKEGPVDIIFCDIEMDSGGLNAAEELRKYCKFLVYVTGHPDYREASQDAGALGFLTKPLRKKAVEALLDVYENVFKSIAAETTVQEKGPLGSLRVKNRQNEQVLLSLNEVIYLRKYGNDVYVSTLGEIYTIYGSLESIKLQYFNTKHFCQIERSYVVAVAAVKCVGEAKVVLRTGESLKLSKSWRFQLLALWSPDGV